MPADMSIEAFWDRLNAALGRAGMSMGALENAAGLGKATLGNGRKRGTMPTIDTVLAIARELDVTVQDLLGDQTPPELRAVAAPPIDAALRRIPFAALTASHLNPRRTIDAAPLQELADSIAAQGLLQNLVVRQDADQPALYWIVAGERRYRALDLLRQAGKMPADLAAHGIPCRVITATDGEHMLLALLENMQRQNVNPMEEAEALSRLHAIDPEKWSTRHISERLGVTQRLVQLRLQLARDLTAEAKAALLAGTITIAQAKIIAATPADAQGDLLSDALDGATAGDLADEMARDMLAAEDAWFDVAESGLPTWTDPNTDRVFITDLKAAIALQRKAIDAMRAQLLAGGAAFVDVQAYLSSGKYAEGGGGAVIVFREYSGKVSLVTDLRRLDKPAAPDDDDEAPPPDRR